MKKVFGGILTHLESGKDVVLVTIIAGSGSTPRGAGARMWVSADGTCEGTIGGGNVEHQAFLKAKKLLETKESVTQGYNLGKQDVANIGMVCGGQVVVYFQYISCADKVFQNLCKEVLQRLEGSEDAWIVMDISDESVWGMGIYTQENGLTGLTVEDMEPLLKGKAVRAQIGDKLYYAEPLVKAGIVYVFGGGHVAQAVVPILSHLDFKCVVLDDREEFACASVFPDAHETILCDFRNLKPSIFVTPNDYVVIMTRGHIHDYEVQRQVLKDNPYYIGVMGSRHKIKFVTEKLLEDGFSKEQIERCHMPIGTEIDAETPAEIAISVAGELIQMRAHKKRG